MPRDKFGPIDFLWRWLFALALVSMTFNPSGYSYYHWVVKISEGLLPLKVLFGLIILVLFVIYLRATWRSIGAIGIALAAAVLGTLIWLLVDIGWLSLEDSTVVGWVAIVLVATVMGMGLSWSHIRRRVTGQLDTDELDD